MGGTKYYKKLASLMLVTWLALGDVTPLLSYANGYSTIKEDDVEEVKTDEDSTIDTSITDSIQEQEDILPELEDSTLQDSPIQDTEGRVNEDESLDTEIGSSQLIELEEVNTSIQDKEEKTTIEDSSKIQEEPSIKTRAGVPTYKLATDSDFSGTTNGTFKYIGKDEYVEVPHTIKGVNVTSYLSMFEFSTVKGVKSTNKNITNMAYMFRNYSTTTLDISELDTSGVKDMSYMFGASNASQTKLTQIIGLDTLDTINVTNMSFMFQQSKVSKIEVGNFNTSNVTTMEGMFKETTPETLNVNNFDTRNVTNMRSMFSNTHTGTLVVDKLDTRKVTNMANMFWGVWAKKLDLSNFNTANVTDMNYMFYGTSAEVLDLRSFDTSKVTNMTGMFRNNLALTIDVSSFNTANVTSMEAMFQESRATTLDVSSFNLQRLTNMRNMFDGSKATTIAGLTELNTLNVRDMAGVFRNTNITKLDLTHFNTSNVTDMSRMFYGAKTENLDLSSFDTRNVTSMLAMFQDSKIPKLNISKFNTTRVKSMSYMFRGVTLDELDLSNFNTDNVQNMSYMFQFSKIPKINTSTFNTSKVNNMMYMYEGTTVKSIDLSNFNTANVTNMRYMFKDTEATTLNISSFNTMKVEEMMGMFQGTKVKTLDLKGFDTYKIADMSDMFNGSLAETINISNFDTSIVTNMENMFKDTSVKTLDLSSFDMGSVNRWDNMFTGTKATYGLSKSREDEDKLNASIGKPNTLKFKPKYVLAKDEDFSGTLNGYFKYTGKDDFVDIPDTIKGVKVNTYSGMFENTRVKGVVSTNKTINSMSNMFRGNTSEELDVRGLTTSGVTTMSGMFQDTKVTTLDLRKFDTEKVTAMVNMFKNTQLKEIDLGSFVTTHLVNTEDMFMGTKATVGYGRTKEDVAKFNSSINKPSSLTFTVWGVQATQSITGWTNKPVNIHVTSDSEVSGIDYITWVNEPSRNLAILKSLASYPGYNTPFIYNKDTYELTTTIKADNSYVFGAKQGLEIGDVYTQSGYLYVNGKPITNALVRGTRLHTGETHLSPLVVDDETGYFKQTHVKNGSDSWWMHAYGTFTLPEGSVVTLKKYKAEKGTEATDFTLSPEDSAVGEEPGVYTVYTNGSYVFRAVDKKGDSKEVVHTVTNIDTVNPTIEVTKSTEGWTSQDVTLYVNAKDDLSGVKTITLPDGTSVQSDKAEFVAKENKDYTFKVTDNAGNSETLKTTVTNIDKSIPKLKATVDNTKWTRDPVNIKVTSGETASGLTSIEMINSPLEGINLAKENQKEVGNIEYGVNTPSNHLSHGSFVRTKGYIPVKGGTVYTITINNAWKVSGSIWQYGEGGEILSDVNDWSNGVNTITFRTFPETRQIRYRFRDYLVTDLDGKTHPLKEWKIKLVKGTKSTPYTPAPEDIPLINNSKTYPVVANGLYTFEAKYNNGSTSEASVNVTNIDLEAPTIKVEDNPTDWVEEDAVILKVNAKDTLSGVSSITLPNGNVINSSTATYKVTKNGEYEFIVKDNVGNSTLHKEKVEYMMVPYSFYIYDKGNKPVKGAEFELLRNNEYYKTSISNSDGLVDFGKVPPDGSYKIKQVSAPDGVVIAPEDIESGDFTEPIEVAKYPRGDIFPSTGTKGTIILGTLIGLTLVGVVVTKKKRNTKSK